MTWNDSDSDFAKHDLVALKDNRTIGIVLTLTSDSLTILDIENYVSTHLKVKVESKLNKN